MDINEIISSLSEDDVNQLKNIAGNLFGAQEKTESQSQDNDILRSIGELSKLFSQEDERTALIKALKPMLGEEKQKRADEAVKILSLIQMIPLLKDSGIFKGLFQ